MRRNFFDSRETRIDGRWSFQREADPDVAPGFVTGTSAN
jgi:hypothetical protein